MCAQSNLTSVGILYIKTKEKLEVLRSDLCSAAVLMGSAKFSHVIRKTK